MKIIILLPLMGLAACATTSADLAESDVDQTFTSAKPPVTVANCAADKMSGSVDVRSDGEHYWVLRNNTYGVPITRWDFHPDGAGGSRIEMRSSLGIATGEGDVRSCL